VRKAIQNETTFIPGGAEGGAPGLPTDAGPAGIASQQTGGARLRKGTGQAIPKTRRQNEPEKQEIIGRGPRAHKPGLHKQKT
jgi:hypothetical protein